MKVLPYKFLGYFLPVALLLSLLATPYTARADVAPPEKPPGSNPAPGTEQTQVRMVSETVILEVLGNTPRGSLGRARVTASFTMRNLGSTAEQMAVRFPLGANDGWGGTPQISGMSVKVDGVSTSIRTITGEDPNFGGDSVPWIEFDADFAPGRDLLIQVSYTLEAGGEPPFVTFSYVFSTGAGWNGTIGSATLFVRFPYEVSELNVLPSYRIDEPNLVKDHKISSTELKWIWTEFEPGKGDNFEIQVVQPSVWENVLKAEAQVKKTSYDGEAWGVLGKLYKSVVFSPRSKGFRLSFIKDDPGAQALYQLSLEAYENAVRLDKIDALWHAGLADLLGYYAYYAGIEGINTMPETMRALKEMHTALKLAWNAERVLTIANELTFYLNDGMVQNGTEFDFPWLTASPTTTSTTTSQPPTETPQIDTATATVERPSATPKPSATATPGKRFYPLCGSAVLLPLLMGGLVFFRRRG